MIDDFITDIKAILVAGDVNDDVLERLAAVMHELVRSPVVDQVHNELAGNIHHGRQSRPPYTDESGLTLVHGRFEPDALTPIHNHGSWGLSESTVGATAIRSGAGWTKAIAQAPRA